MDNFLATVGSITIAMLIIFIIKKINDNFRGDFIYVANEKVFKAAKAFTRGV